MIIQNKLRKEWKLLHSHGDYTKIAARIGVTTQTVREAIRDGKCSDRIYKGLVEFYADKQKMIDSLEHLD